MAQEAFTQLLDRCLTSDGRLSIWCPNMDLMAVATMDGQVAVYRLIWQPPSWQQLWAVAPEAGVSSLCWRPDGKALAAGHSDGSVMVLGVESGELLHRMSLHCSPVVAMSWVEGHNTVPVEDRIHRFFPPPVPADEPPMQPAADIYANLGRTGGGTGGGGPAGRRQWPQRPQNMNVLVSADSGGGVNICAHGTFLLASFGLHDVLPAGAATKELLPTGLAQSRDLRQLAVLCRAQGGQGLCPQLRLAVVDTAVFADRSSELQALALQMSEVNALLDRASGAVRKAGGKWQDAMKQAGAKWEQMGSVLADHGCEGSPRQDLLNLLACGIPSDGTRHFLQASLGEQNTKRLAKAVDAAVMDVHELLLDVVSPALDMIIFRLGELQGLAACSEWIRPIELQADVLKSAEQKCGRLLIRVNQVMHMVSRAGALYRGFFLWLLKTILVLNFENADHKPLQDITWPTNNNQDVLEFLETQMCSDAIALEFGTLGRAEGDKAAGGHCEASATAMSGEAEELQDLLLGAPPLEETLRPAEQGLLVGSLEDLGASCAQVQASLPAMMASSFRATAWVAVADCPEEQEGLGGNIIGRIQAGKEPSCIDLLVAVPKTEGGPSSMCLLASIRHCGASSDSGTASIWAQLGLLPAATPAKGGGGGPGEQPAACPDITALAFATPHATAPSPGQDNRTAKGRILDVGFYKDGQVALLTSSSEDYDLSQDSPDGGGGYVQASRLILVNTKDSAMESCVQMVHGNSSGVSLEDTLLVTHMAQGTIFTTLPETSLRSRACPGVSISTPLAVSAARGVGCVLASGQRAVIFDLEEDEEEDAADKDENGV